MQQLVLRSFFSVCMVALAFVANGQCLDSLQFPNLQPPCYPDFIPVCGCDGITYRNACYADYATVLQYVDGPCEQVVFDFYPNPAIDMIYMTLATKYESDVNLYIFDRNGIVSYYSFYPNVTAEFVTLPVYWFEQGLYIIVAESNGVLHKAKFMKWQP